MKKTFGLNKLFCYGMFMFSMMPVAVYAYIDPGAGSYLFQILAASALTGVFFIKTIAQKTKLFVRRLFSKNKTKDKSKKNDG